jgi:hypothetical protein
MPVDSSVTTMDRRRFLVQSSLFAAGSAIGSSLFGCASIHDGTVIPCLGTASAPTPVAGMTYIRASELGCALDCDLEFGYNKHTYGAATDDGPLINAALAAASANHPITLIIDGSALISGLFLPAGGYWSIAGLGCGTGFFVKDGTNNDGIHNGERDAAVPSDPGPPVPPRGRNVSLSNFAINGNASKNSTSGFRQGNSARGVWYFGINLMDLENVTIENVAVVNTPAFHIRLSNVGHVKISGCVLRSHGPSTDGIHFDGPANDISISNCDFVTDDDAIALNCPEGHTGNISRVTVDNCTFESWSLMRMDTLQCSGCARYNIDTVSVSNCKGTLFEAGFFIGQGAKANADSVTGLKISNCTLTAPAVLEVGANFGGVELDNVTLIPSHAHQPNQFFPPGYGFVRTSKYFFGCTYVGSNLTINNCTVQRTGDHPVSFLILEYGSSINNLFFNGFKIEDPAGRSYRPVPRLVEIADGSLGCLMLNALDSSKIALPVDFDQFSWISEVQGSGVLATNWEFPDSVMADGVPYLSATTGLPSIKIDGVVVPYK